MPDNTLKKRTQVGSGDSYLVEVPENLDLSDITKLCAVLKTNCIEANRFGDTKNGATLTYTPETYEVTDDMGRIAEVYITKETVTFQLGLVTVNGDILNKLLETAVVTKSGEKSMVKIGGISKAKGKDYLLIFRHVNAKHGDTYIVIAGHNTAELSFAFQPGAETVLNPTFTANALDSEGTKVIVYFDDPENSALSASTE